MSDSEDLKSSQPERSVHVDWKTLAKWAFGGLALLLLLVAIWQERVDFFDAVARLRPPTILAALAFGALAAVFNTLSWRMAYSGLGIDLPLGTSFRVFLVSQIGKYIPGSVWPVLAQMEMARDRGISRARAGTASIVSMLVGVVTAALASVLVLFTEGPGVLGQYWGVLLVAPLGLIALTPPVLGRLLQIVGRVIRRPLDSTGLRGRSLAASVFWGMLMWIAFGLHAWFILRDLVPEVHVGFTAAAGAFALAWVVGFLFVLAPAGVGVREVILVVALGGTLGRPDALALAIVSRVLLTVIDLCGAGVGIMIPKRRTEPGTEG